MDDDGVEYYDESDDEEDDGGEGNELKSEKLKQFMLSFCKGYYDDDIEEALGRSADHRLPTTIHAECIDLYRKPADWMERNAIGLENVKAQLQEHTRSAEDGGEFNLYLNHNLTSRIEEEPVVWHDPSIAPYWEQLTAALFHHHVNIHISGRIWILNIEMQKESVAALARSLCDGRAINSISHVMFVNTNLCSDGVVLVSILVEQSSRLNQLNISRNRIDDMNSAMHLSRTLKTHPNMKFLDMEQCDLGNDPDILAVILQSDVKGIILSHNNLDSLGMAKISEYLAGNPPVKYLVLDNNDFNDDDAFLISQALK